VPVQLQVVGCESGSAMVAVMTAPLKPGADVQAILAGWQQATLAHAGVKQPLSESQQQSWPRPGFLPLAAAVRVQAQGQRSDGQPVFMQAVWGAVSEDDHVRVVHAVVYDPRDPRDLAASLFDGIRP